MTCKKCKKICKFCLRVLETNQLSYDTRERIYNCDKIKETKLNCVTGSMEEIHFTCEELNKTGDCPFYEKNARLILETELIEKLTSYLDDFINPDHYSAYDEPFVSRDILYACLYILKGESCSILDTLNKMGKKHDD